METDLLQMMDGKFTVIYSPAWATGWRTEDPSPLEVLLAERIVSLWLVVEVLETLLNVQFERGEGAPRTPPSYLKFILGWLESYHRHYLASIQELARVRRLQSNTPSVQVNAQINLTGSEEA